LGFGAQKAKALGAGTDEAGSSGTQAGIARSATSAAQGVKSLGAAKGSSSELFAGNQNFRAQWELAVSQQSRGAETLAEEKSTDSPEIADGVPAQSFLENAAEATLSKPNGAMVNGATVLAARRMQTPAQIDAIVLTADESATQNEAVAATAADGSKTRDRVMSKSAEHNSPAKSTGAEAGAGNLAMQAMDAMQPAPMVALIQQLTQTQQPAHVKPAVDSALAASTINSAQELLLNKGVGLPDAAPHSAAKNFAPAVDSPEDLQGVATHTAGTDFTLPDDAAGDVMNVAPRAVAVNLPLLSDSAGAGRNTATLAVTTHSAPPANSARAATNASNGGTGASIETAAAPQSETESATAGNVSNFVLGRAAYVSGQIAAAAPAIAGAAKVQSGMQSGMRSRATVQGGNALAPAATPEMANGSGGEGSKLDVNGFDATPGRQKSVGSGSVDSGSAPAAIMHSVQAVNPGGDQTGLIQPGSIRVEAGGEGGSNLPASHAVASGNATGQASVGSAGATFAALDSGSAFGAGTSVGTPGWIHASGQRAEAGFEDPVLGWVGVRADVVSGTVHAAILPGSAEAATELSTHLTGLGSYLSEQYATVSAVTVAAPAQQGIESGAGQNLQQNAQQNSGEDANGARETREQAGRGAVSGAVTWSGSADASEMVPMDSLGGMRGANISVMV
jgi:hypothetical protein